MTTHQIFQRVLAETNSVELSETEAKKIRSALGGLRAAAELEELYDLLVSDYAEFESTILGSAVEQLVRRARSEEQFDAMRRLFNRRIMHILTVARSYLDCGPRLVGEIVDAYDEGVACFRQLVSAQYDQNLGYRVLEAMRNSAQHHGLPLHGSTLGGAWVAIGQQMQGRMHSYAMPTVSIDELERDKGFKRSVLKELRAIGKKFDVRDFVRVYLECLSEVQDAVRKFIAGSIVRAHGDVSAAISRWLIANPGRKDLGLAIVDVDDSGRHSNTVPLNLRTFEVAERLKTENRRLANLSVSFISNSTGKIVQMSAED